MQFSAPPLPCASHDMARADKLHRALRGRQGDQRVAPLRHGAKTNRNAQHGNTAKLGQRLLRQELAGVRIFDKLLGHDNHEQAGLDCRVEQRKNVEAGSLGYIFHQQNRQKRQHRKAEIGQQDRPRHHGRHAFAFGGDTKVNEFAA